ncbi:MAG: RluA family pseudouridine synthase [Bacilli bacterium]|nr:RluA family pseudouridine synthase [Bacilli bacterium]
METIKLEENVGRIDTYLMQKLDISRSKIQKMMEASYIKVNGTKCKNSYIVKQGDTITIDEYEEEALAAEPENIPLNIVYEDDDVIVVDKENGMVVHPAVGNKRGTLVNALMYHAKTLSDLNGSFRPGIVHRIDAYTTGLLMVAKNNKAHELLAKQLEEKTTYRRYMALVHGVIVHDTGTIDAPIGRDEKDRKKMSVVSGGKKAITHFKVLERYKDATLLSLELETGRTHQIRVHLNYIGHPVVNDPAYGNRKKTDETGQCLHAEGLGFIHPKTGEYMEFHSPLPETFQNILKIYQSHN